MEINGITVNTIISGKKWKLTFKKIPGSIGCSFNLFVFVVWGDSIVLHAFLFLDLRAG